MRSRHLFALPVVALLLPGCVFGLIYQNTIQPLDLDHNDTPVFTKRGETADGDMRRLTIYVSVEWDGYDIGSIAKKNGIEEIHYVDVETLRVPFWTQTFAHIYGRPVPDTPSAAAASAPDASAP